MRRIVVTLALLLAAFVVCLTQPAVMIKTIPLSEVSGAVNIGNDRVLLIADEGYQVQLVSKADATFGAGDPNTFSANMKPPHPALDGGKKRVDDLEDVAWDDKRQVAYIITSHSRSKKQDDVADPQADKPPRHNLARLSLRAGSTDAPRELDVLALALKQFPFVREAMKQPHQAGGSAGTFNIEGLAFDAQADALLIGLRSPTQDCMGKPHAVVLTLKNPHKLFEPNPAAPEFDQQVRLLDLGGLGIRGMTCDAQRQGCWLVAGRSADPDTPTDQVASALYFWQPGKPAQPQKVQADLLGLDNLESVSLLTRGGKPGLLLISDDGGNNNTSRYHWIPMP